MFGNGTTNEGEPDIGREEKKQKKDTRTERKILESER
jgi:hypothetical protein